MDTELVVWIAVFVGGYSAVVGYLLWVALRKGEDAGKGPGAADPGGPPPGGPGPTTGPDDPGFTSGPGDPGPASGPARS